MLGIAFTDTEIHAVLTKGTAAKGSVEKSIVEKLPEGAIHNGVLADAAKVIEALKKIRKTADTTNVVVCLPPERVYCVNFTVIPERGKSFRELLEVAMEQHIPEERSGLQYQTKILKTTKEGKQVGVIAIRKDILTGWVDACRQAGMIVKSVTSLPLALCQKESAMVVTAGSSFKSTMTLFMRGWPIDEAVLPEKATDSTIADELREFMEEYRSEYPVHAIQVVGGAALLKKMQEAFAPKEKVKDAQQSEPSVSVSGLLSWVKEKEMPMLGAIAASIVGYGGFNLLRTQKQRTATAVLALILVLVACAGVVAYFRPDLLHWF